MLRSPHGWSVAAPGRWLWWVVLGGLLVLYLPVYWNAAFGAKAVWQSDEDAHGPIVLAVIAWLFWSERHAIAALESKPTPAIGWALFSLGMLSYLFGRVLSITSAEFLSHIFVVCGVLLLMKGPMALRLAWFPILYLVFLVPLPSTLVDAMTNVLKHWIAAIVEGTLHATGYPIARTGAMMTVGPYELLVADACSGLHSMFSLSALGTLHMYLMRRPGLLHNAIMLAAILPIAFLSNIIRVIILVLVTYHLGDAAGQGFLHGAAGIVLMLVALAAFFLFDRLLALVLGTRGSQPPKRPTQQVR